ncbi:MAG: alpha/beta hydrolase-fold protein [Terracoccus sp.]
MGRSKMQIETPQVGAVDLAVVSPTHTRRTEPLPLLVVHDGPEYSRRAHLFRSLREWTADGRMRPHRVALLEPGPRNERYAANPRWAEALTQQVLPTVRAAYETAGKPTVMGASLGGLASLQAEWLHPGTFGGLFLQSGSYFRKRVDDEESFEHWDRVTDFVSSVRRARRARTDAQIVITCGDAEGNLTNNRQMAQTLDRLGHETHFAQLRGGHDWRSWQSGFDPHLLQVLAR